MIFARSIFAGYRWNLLDSQRRTLKKEIRNKMKEKFHSKNLALEYFDFFYSATFGAKWNKIRLGMLTGSKHVALLNNYSNIDKTKKNLLSQASMDFFDFSLKYELGSIKGDTQNNREKLDKLKKLKIPGGLKVYCFDNGDTRKFDEPESDESKLMNYYCMDASSIFPILAMDIQKGDNILDLCASPGGKTLVMLQTMLPGTVTCRDIKAGRIERLKRMLKSYINAEDLDRLVKVEFNTQKFGLSSDEELFDKVLVDVPCTNDRKSLNVEDNNIFSRKRIDERTELPEKQSELLRQGIDSCKINGTIVYSTCSLSPIQNEGVVNSVLQSYETNPKFRLKVESLNHLKINFQYFFSFYEPCKLGLLIIPEISKNYGPFYLCKISKLPK